MRIEFYLYVKEETQELKELVRTLTEQIRKHCGKDASLKVVSILSNPSVVEKHQIFVTPTLIKMYPPPPKKVFLNLNDKNQVKKVIEKVC